MLTISSGAYPQAIGFDTKAGLIYAQNHQSSLMVFDVKGIKQKEFSLENVKGGRGEQPRQFLVHPTGRQLLVLTDQGGSEVKAKVYAVELTASDGALAKNDNQVPKDSPPML